MAKAQRCDFCRMELDAGREFVYQFESLDFAGDEATQEAIAASGEYYEGEPLRMCAECHASHRQNQAELEQEDLAERAKTRVMGTVMIVVVGGSFAVAGLLLWL